MPIDPFVTMFLLVIAIILFFTFVRIKIIPEYERLVVFRLGRLHSVRGPGVTYIIAGIETAKIIDLRVQTIDIPDQEVITKDNINIKVDAAVLYRIVDPMKLVLSLKDVYKTLYLLGQTALRDVLGDFELDEILVNREELAKKIQQIVDEQVAPWGIKITSISLQQIVLPEQLIRAMAAQAEAERERRAKIIAAEGERQAAQIIAEAAEFFEKHPVALRLRELNTIIDVAKEKNTIILFPVNISGVELSQVLALALQKTKQQESS